MDSPSLRLGRLEILSALAGGVTHELSNLAASVMMSVQILEPCCQKPSDRQVLASLDELAGRLQHAGRQLHWLARGICGEATVFQPQYLLSDLQRLARVAFPSSIGVVTRYPPDLWPLVGDPLIVYQLLLTLCLEARDLLAGSGTVVLAASNQELTCSEAAALAAAAAEVAATADPAGTGGSGSGSCRYVVLEAIAEAPAAEASAPPAVAIAAACASRPSSESAPNRRTAATARRAAAAAGGFIALLPPGATGRGHRAYVPAALVEYPER